MSSNKGAIHIEDLCFSYTPKEPLIHGMGFQVEKGEIFGFLGPSGAGKSTLQKILTGVLTGYGGTVQVNGTEVKHRRADFYESIGVVFEFPGLYGKFTALENLAFFGSLHRGGLIPPETLLEMVGLQRDGHRRVSEFSKGMKTRLNFVRALMHRPGMLFLDEPTSGLDPSTARQVKGIIQEQKRMGTTVILTTHNMHDAGELCDRVAFIVDGGIRALDTPENLTVGKEPATVSYSFREGMEELHNATSITRLSEDEALLNAIRNNRITRIHSKEPSLEDVFVEVTGRSLR